MVLNNIFYNPIKLKNFLKKKGIDKKVVMSHGVFDVLHYGHFLHFKEAKKYGKVLVVSITSDKYVNKGINRPIFNLKTRLNSVAMIQGVDYVVASNSPTAEKNLKIIRPNVYYKGPDYKENKDLSGKLDREIKVARLYEWLYLWNTSENRGVLIYSI